MYHIYNKVATLQLCRSVTIFGLLRPLLLTLDSFSQSAFLWVARGCGLPNHDTKVQII